MEEVLKKLSSLNVNQVKDVAVVLGFSRSNTKSKILKIVSAVPLTGEEWATNFLKQKCKDLTGHFRGKTRESYLAAIQEKDPTFSEYKIPPATETSWVTRIEAAIAKVQDIHTAEQNPPHAASNDDATEDHTVEQNPPPADNNDDAAEQNSHPIHNFSKTIPEDNLKRYFAAVTKESTNLRNSCLNELKKLETGKHEPNHIPSVNTDAGLNGFDEALLLIADKLDAVQFIPDAPQAEVERLIEQLEQQHQLFVAASTTAAALAKMLPVPEQRNCIESQIARQKTQFDDLQVNLIKRKQIFADISDWCKTCLVAITVLHGFFEGPLQVSADLKKLQLQIENHDSIYQEIMLRKLEIDKLMNAGEKLKENLILPIDTMDHYSSQLQKLLQDVTNDAESRRRTLNNCLEQGRKYFNASSTCLGWLRAHDPFPLNGVSEVEFSQQNEAVKQCTELGCAYNMNCDIDTNLVYDELEQIAKRWNAITIKVKEQENRSVAPASGNSTALTTELNTTMVDVVRAEEFLNLMTNEEILPNLLNIRHAKFQLDFFKKHTIDALDQRIPKFNESINNTSGEAVQKFIQLWRNVIAKLNKMYENLFNNLWMHLTEQFKSESKWLDNVEEMVRNQKPPTLQNDVIMNQLSEQRFLAQLLADHQQSLQSLRNLANEVSEFTDEIKTSIDDSMNEIMARFNQLVAAEKDRSNLLDEAKRGCTTTTANAENELNGMESHPCNPMPDSSASKKDDTNMVSKTTPTVNTDSEGTQHNPIVPTVPIVDLIGASDVNTSKKSDPSKRKSDSLAPQNTNKAAKRPIHSNDVQPGKQPRSSIPTPIVQTIEVPDPDVTNVELANQRVVVTNAEVPKQTPTVELPVTVSPPAKKPRLNPFVYMMKLPQPKAVPTAILVPDVTTPIQSSSDAIDGTQQPEILPKLNKKPRSKRMEVQKKKTNVNRPNLDADEPVLVTFTTSPLFITNGQMKEHQIDGLNWLISLYQKRINGILADEMGLGKTLQTIALLGYVKNELQLTTPNLLLTPKSTLQNWSNELKKWCPSLNASVLSGDSENRQSILRRMSQCKDSCVIITTYEMYSLESETIEMQKWNYLIIDEGHHIKNGTTDLAQLVRNLDCEHRLLLTGTPFQNTIQEFWSLLNFLQPDVFEDYSEFPKEPKEIHNLIRPFILRRMKAVVHPSLPPKIVEIVSTKLTAMQQELYDSIPSNDFTTHIDLRKCVNHPFLIGGDDKRQDLVESCGKMQTLVKLLNECKNNGSRVLIFSQMTQMLDILQTFCDQRRYKYCRLDGQLSEHQRNNQIEAFNKPDKFIFLLSTRAGGVGINLVCANVVIIYDSDWNPQMDLQAIDRAHRIGQTKPVTVYKFVTENTIEEHMFRTAEDKLQLSNIIIDKGNFSVNFDK